MSVAEYVPGNSSTSCLPACPSDWLKSVCWLLARTLALLAFVLARLLPARLPACFDRFHSCAVILGHPAQTCVQPIRPLCPSCIFSCRPQIIIWTQLCNNCWISLTMDDKHFEVINGQLIPISHTLTPALQSNIKITNACMFQHC